MFDIAWCEKYDIFVLYLLYFIKKEIFVTFYIKEIFLAICDQGD